MSYATIIRDLPEDLRFPMLELAEAIEQNMRAQLAVRREDFESLHGVMREAAEMQYRADQRLDRLETALVDLAEAQARTEQRVEELVEAQARTEQRVEELAEAQARTEQRVEELVEAQARTEQRVEELAEAQARTEQRVEELAEAQRRTDQQIAELTEAIRLLAIRMDRVEAKLDRVDGDRLERRYRERAYGYFGSVLRRARPVNFTDIEETLEDRLAETEVNELRLLDLIVRGRPKAQPDLEELWLAVEVSVTIDERDVERALRRATLLRQAGIPALPVAAGENQTERASVNAANLGVVVVHNGTIKNWDEAVRIALA